MSSSQPLASFPLEVRDAHARWLANHDLAALDIVVLAIVAHHRTSRSRSPEAMPDTARLIEDLGYDSLTLAEIVFFIEDVFHVSISTEDLRKIATIADLRAYLRAQVTPARPSA
jgi:acyl carrier protein